MSNLHFNLTSKGRRIDVSESFDDRAVRFVKELLKWFDVKCSKSRVMIMDPFGESLLFYDWPLFNESFN